MSWTTVRDSYDFPPPGKLVLGHYAYGYVLCRLRESPEGRHWVDNNGNYIESLDDNDGPDLWMEIPDLPLEAV